MAQAPAPDSPAIEAKAHALLARLTLGQKIDLLGGVDGMFTHAAPAIGLPRFKMSDGPEGVRTWLAAILNIFRRIPSWPRA
jgi:beta-glucosidase